MAYDPATPLLGIYPPKNVVTKTEQWMFIVALFIVVKNLETT